MPYKNYLFDLDGTLTDPGKGIKNSIRYAIKKFGCSELPEEQLNHFIGPPLLDSFQKYCGVSVEDAKTLLEMYREYFGEKGIFENEVYAGIPETLSALRKRGATLCLATSKPEPYAERILEHFDLRKYFSFVGGSTMDETRIDKGEVISYVLESMRLKASETVMIGDRKYDVTGGHQCGVKTVGVLFGYGEERELAKADYLIKNPRDILNL